MVSLANWCIPTLTYIPHPFSRDEHSYPATRVPKRVAKRAPVLLKFAISCRLQALLLLVVSLSKKQQ